MAVYTREPIRTRYLFGYLYEHKSEGRQAEVIRADAEAGIWHTFFYAEHKQICLGDCPRLTYTEAVQQALAYMKEGEMPNYGQEPRVTEHVMKHV